MLLEKFQMLDRIDGFNPERSLLTASATVPKHSPVFEGHFPGHALMPGVLLLETMAQASGYLLMALDGFARMPFFANVKAANFRAFVLPGDELAIEAERDHAGSGFAVMSAQIRRGGQRVCDAQMTFRLVPFPAAALENHVRAEGQRLGFFGPAQAR
ncbi:MAG: beta-hydroxyacyl-ACP dehydratase [Hyphomicrobiaceae bacterium]|nr:beta-hydroxyacyl-ACP dehydratase [Hyphomicrobiaceae bacterium]